MTHQCSFLASGTSQNISIDIPTTNINFGQGTYAICIESIGIWPETTTVTSRGGKVYAKLSDIEDCEITSLAFIDCSAVNSNYYINKSLQVINVPLCHFHLNLNKKCTFQRFPPYWHSMNNFDGKLSFCLKSDFVTQTPVQLNNKIQIYFHIKRIF